MDNEFWSDLWRDTAIVAAAALILYLLAGCAPEHEAARHALPPRFPVKLAVGNDMPLDQAERVIAQVDRINAAVGLEAVILKSYEDRELADLMEYHVDFVEVVPDHVRWEHGEPVLVSGETLSGLVKQTKDWRKHVYIDTSAGDDVIAHELLHTLGVCHGYGIMREELPLGDILPEHVEQVLRFALRESGW